jgi:ArsR family transcriptional regulator, arsenate/arsenite/antimonite-responsive transcriptional repressor
VISGEIDGPRVCYALNPKALSLLADFVGSLKSPDTDDCCIPEPKAAE